MKILCKRILIMFSVALNIGFIIMAVTIPYNHSASYHQRSWLAPEKIVQDLELSQAQEDQAIQSIKQFKNSVDRQHEEIKKARKDILSLLAQAGPVNPDELHRVIESVDRQEVYNNKVFEDHVLELRRQLGDEKGAQYFAAMLEHAKTDKRLQHR